MKTPHRHRLLAALALGALLATGFSVSAEPAAARDKDRKEQRNDQREHRQDRRENRQERRHERREDRQERRHERREDRREARHDRRDDRRDVRQYRERQQARARIAQQRAYQHRMHEQRVRAQRARAAAQRRAAMTRHYSYSAPMYRYNHGGRWYSTSHYGANVLRQAVQRGYQEGLRAGRSDRYDRWGYDHRRSRIWIDGSHGFGGRYVSRNDYAYYFRQGFQRGYEDGYYSRGRYGHRVNGEAIIIQAVLEAILGFQRLG